MNYATRKDQLPESTVLKIKTILKSINIEPTIRHVCEKEVRAINEHYGGFTRTAIVS